MNSIAMNDRLVLHALVDELERDGDTFDAVQVGQLIARVPITPKSSPLHAVQGSWTGSSSHSGTAAGVDQGDIKDEEQKSAGFGTDRR